MDTRQTVSYKEKALRLVANMLEEISQLAAEWDELTEDERIMVALEWRDAVDHLAFLEEEHAAGGLTGREEERYSELRADLKEALPIIERLGLRRPTVPL